LIVLDTHAWPWRVAAPARLSEAARESLADDRFIFATARALDAPLLTRDRRLRAFAPDATVW
jgi:PIN domain nuclease of toxin-antitoxin system